MPRTIEFAEDKMILHLTGLTSVAALKRNGFLLNELPQILFLPIHHRM